MPIDLLASLESFFRLDFLFSGLEVSSGTIFAARFTVLLVFGAGAIWAVVRLSLKLGDCLQTLLETLSRLPGWSVLVLLVLIPVSPHSPAARWMGYVLLICCLIALAGGIVLTAIAWKYGVDQALRLARAFGRKAEDRPAPAHGEPASGEGVLAAAPPHTVTTAVGDPGATIKTGWWQTGCQAGEQV